MRDLADVIARWLLVAARTSLMQWVLRLAVLAAGLLACQLTMTWLQVFIAPVFYVLAGLALVASALRPDTGMPAVFIVLLLMWWLIGGWNVDWWRAVVMSMLIAVVQVGSAWAATGPSHQRGTRRLLAPMTRAAAGYLGATLAGTAVVVGAAHLPAGLIPRGWVWVLAAAVALAIVAMRVLPRRG